MVPEDTQSESEVSSDAPAGSDSLPEFQTDSESSADSESSTDSESDTDTPSDSEILPPSCDGYNVIPGDSTRTLVVGTDTRSYILHIPSAYEGPAALLFDYHALNGTAEGQRSGSIYPPVTDPDGVVMAFPQGLYGAKGNAWNFGPCCVDGVDDTAFTMAMIDDIKTVACIDPTRIYAAGIYVGGGLAYALACHEANVFAAVASSAFDLAEQTITDCVPSRPITVVSFRTPEDLLMSWEGGTGVVFPEPLDFLGAEGTLQKWAELNGCTGQTTTDANNCEQVLQCQAGVEVMLCIGAGPDTRGDGNIGWEVLKRHVLPPL